MTTTQPIDQFTASRVVTSASRLPSRAERDRRAAQAPAGAATCKGCGCSEFTPCLHAHIGPCWWSLADELCSHCTADVRQIMADAEAAEAETADAASAEAA